MLAQNNEYINEASETVYHLTQEEQIRQQCEAREDYYRRQLGIQQIMEKQEKTIETLSLEKEAWTAEKEAWTVEKEAWAAEKEAWTAEKEALYSELVMLRAKISESKDKK